MKKTLIAILAILLPMASMAQKGHHFEFDYFAIELGSTHCFSAQPDPCMNFYYYGDEGKVHLNPVQGKFYTPGYNLGVQFHHDLQNDKNGFILGAVVNSWGNTAKYQSDSRSITLTQTQRVMSLGIPAYIKLGHEIYNQQCYFFMGTQVDFNLSLTTAQKVNGIDVTHRTDANKDALRKVCVPIIIGFNYTIMNFKLGIQPKGFLDPDYEMMLGDQVIKPFEGSSKVTVFGNFGFVIPLSQWTTKRSYILSRIF